MEKGEIDVKVLCKSAIAPAHFEKAIIRVYRALGLHKQRRRKDYLAAKAAKAASTEN